MLKSPHSPDPLVSWVPYLAHGGYATGMPIDLSIAPGSCANCILGKQKWSSVSQTWQGTRAIRKLGIVHVDLLEHPEHVSSLGNKYVLNIINDFSSYTWSLPLLPNLMHTKHSWIGNVHGNSTVN